MSLLVNDAEAGLRVFELGICAGERGAGTFESQREPEMLTDSGG